MHIVIAGSGDITEEIKQKFGYAHEYSLVNQHPVIPVDILFDLNPEEGIRHYQEYLQSTETIIFAQSLYFGLNRIISNGINEPERVFGFCGWPTFINRKILEVTSLSKTDEKINEICKKLGTDFRRVSDRVGMVTPRIVAMIINEAYFTVQEGTASKSDIDKAMKLGTNYPFGPFEWGKKIGLGNVYQLLDAMYLDTREERYKICPLLKNEVNQKDEKL